MSKILFRLNRLKVNKILFQTESGGSSIALESQSSPNIDGSSENPEDWTHTIGNLTNGYIIVSFSYYGGTITSATFDGAAMTLLESHAYSVDTPQQCAIFGLAVGNKAAGTYTISVSASSGAEFNGISSAFNNVHQSISTGGATSAEGVGTDVSVTVSSATGETVVDHVNSYSNASWTVGSNQTAIYTDTTGLTDGASSYEVGASSVIMSWTKSNAATPWIICAVALKPS